jgi:hypothetical protein
MVRIISRMMGSCSRSLKYFSSFSLITNLLVDFNSGALKCGTQGLRGKAVEALKLSLRFQVSVFRHCIFDGIIRLFLKKNRWRRIQMLTKLLNSPAANRAVSERGNLSR